MGYVVCICYVNTRLVLQLGACIHATEADSLITFKSQLILISYDSFMNQMICSYIILCALLLSKFVEQESLQKLDVAVLVNTQPRSRHILCFVLRIIRKLLIVYKSKLYNTGIQGLNHQQAGMSRKAEQFYFPFFRIVFLKHTMHRITNSKWFIGKK